MVKILIRHIVLAPIYGKWEGGEYLRFETGEVVIGMVELPNITETLTREQIDKIIAERTPILLRRYEAMDILGSYRNRYGGTVSINPERSIEWLIDGRDHSIQIRTHIPQCYIINNYGLTILT